MSVGKVRPTTRRSLASRPLGEGTTTMPRAAPGTRASRRRDAGRAQRPGRDAGRRRRSPQPIADVASFREHIELRHREPGALADDADEITPRRVLSPKSDRLALRQGAWPVFTGAEPITASTRGRRAEIVAAPARQGGRRRAAAPADRSEEMLILDWIRPRRRRPRSPGADVLNVTAETDSHGLQADAGAGRTRRERQDRRVEDGLRRRPVGDEPGHPIMEASRGPAQWPQARPLTPRRDGGSTTSRPPGRPFFSLTRSTRSGPSQLFNRHADGETCRDSKPEHEEFLRRRREGWRQRDVAIAYGKRAALQTRARATACTAGLDRREKRARRHLTGS